MTHIIQSCTISKSWKKRESVRGVSLAALLFLMLLAQSCGVYSLSGTSIAADVSTISVQNFYNDSGGGPANLSQSFTEQLKDYYQKNTNLSLVQEQGDLQVEGRIIGYALQPAAPVSGDIAAQNRLTITVQVDFINVKHDEQSFDNKSFSFFRDYPQGENLADVEVALVNDITEQIVLDIFNQTVATW